MCCTASSKFQHPNCFRDPVCCPLAFFRCQTHSPSAWLNAHFSPKIRESSVYQDSSLILLNYRLFTSETVTPTLELAWSTSFTTVCSASPLGCIFFLSAFVSLFLMHGRFLYVFITVSFFCASFPSAHTFHIFCILSFSYLQPDFFYLSFLFPFLIFALWSFSLFPSSVCFPLLPESRLRSLFSSVFLSLITLFLCFASSESASIFSSSLLPSYSSRFLSPFLYRQWQWGIGSSPPSFYLLFLSFSPTSPFTLLPYLSAPVRSQAGTLLSNDLDR